MPCDLLTGPFRSQMNLGAPQAETLLAFKMLCILAAHFGDSRTLTLLYTDPAARLGNPR